MCYIERAPALLDNALLMFVAPFFFVFEVLNLVVGYKGADVKKWDIIVAREIQQFKQNKIKKRSE